MKITHIHRYIQHKLHPKSVLAVVLQVWTRRTSSCPPALLCPAGVALAMVQPVRSRSSAAPAASRDPASRRSCDHPENSPTFLFLLLQLSAPPACQTSCCTPLSTLFISSSSFFMVVALAGRVIFCFASRRNISEGKLEFSAA